VVWHLWEGEGSDYCNYLHDFNSLVIKMKSRTISIILASMMAMAGILPAFGSVPLSLSLDFTHPGPAIPDDFAGLSYETKREMSDVQGNYYFTAQNLPLIKIFETIGIKNLRIGGNTVDSSKVGIPVQADIDNLFQFAQAADTKVIYSFRMNHGDAAASATQAKYIADNYHTNLLCFSIGNEPDIFVHSYSSYLKEWRPIYDAINQAVPGAKYCGPSLTSNAQPWAHDFARDFFPSGRILYVTQHEYAGGAGGKVENPIHGRDLLLSPAWHDIYQLYYDKFVPPLEEMGVPYRLEEANNFYNGGAKDVNDTFASALWGVDYLYWWAAHGSQGINFHNGDEVAAGQNLTPCRYASFTSVPGGYFAHPLSYGIKLFNLGSHGRLIPSTLTPDATAPDINIVSYAVLEADKTLDVTLINKEHNAGARDALVTIQTAAMSFAKARIMTLKAPQNDAAAKDGVTLGGNSIQPDGTWQEKWTELAPPGSKPLEVPVPACSAVLVRLTGT
jgi:hypothetical protein